MANSKPKPTSKKPAAKSPKAPSARVVIEVVIRNETAGAALKSLPDTFLLHDGPAGQASNFTYSFDLANMRILHLIVGEKRIDSPPDSGDFLARVMDPNDPPQIRVTVVAVSTKPAPSGSLSLKYLGKAVFDAKNIPMKAAQGGFDELVKLPV